MATEPKLPKLGEVTYTISPKQEKAESGPLIGGEGSSAVGNVLGNFAQGAAAVLASPFKAVDRGLGALAGVRYTDEKASPIGKLGQGIENIVGSVAAPDPEKAESIPSKVGAAFGSAAGFMLPLGLAGAASRVAGAVGSAGLGAAATGVEQAEDYDRARQAAGLEVDPADQGAALFYGAIPGTLEAVPLARMFTRLDKMAGGTVSQALKGVAAGTAEEALQEAAQNTASNFIASNIVKYDPERELFVDTPEAAAIGGGVGFVLNSIFAGIGLRRKGPGQQAADRAAEQPIQIDPKNISAEEQEAAKIDPVTGLELQTGELTKVNVQLARLQKMVDSAPEGSTNRKQIEDRIDAIKEDIEKKYFEQNEEGEYTKSVIERQEAADVLGQGQVEEVEVTAPTAVEEEFPAAEAEPFPSKKGIKVNKDINEPKAVERFNKKLAETQVEEIDLADTPIPTDLPTSAELIETEEVDAEIEEIALDSTPDLPDRATFLADKPSNLVFADALKSIAEQRKRRTETDEAFEKRKQLEIAEAYRQREEQRIQEEYEEVPQQEAVVQQAAPDTTDQLQTEQTQEEVPTPTQRPEVTPNEQQATTQTAPEVEQATDQVPVAQEPQAPARQSQEAAQVTTLETPLSKERRAWHGGTWDGKADFVSESGNNILFAATSKKYAEQYAAEYDGEGRVTELSIAPNKQLDLYNSVFDDKQGLSPRIQEVLRGIGITPDRGLAVSFFRDAGAMTYLRKQKDLVEYALKNGYQSILIPDSNPDLSTSTMSSVVVLDPAIVKVADPAPKATVSTPVGTSTEKVKKVNKKKAEADNVPLVGKGLMGKKDGKPFASERAAKTARTRAGLTDSSAIVAVEGGFAVRPAANPVDSMEGEKQAESEGTATETVLDNGQAPKEVGEYITTDPLQTETVDPEVYNAVMVLSEKMAKAQNPERYAPYIIKTFGSVKEFMALRARITEGDIVPGDTTKIVKTPVGEIENVKETKPEPEVVTAIKLQQDPVQEATNKKESIKADLAEIEEKIARLEKTIASGKGNDKLQDRLDNYKAQRNGMQKHEWVAEQKEEEIESMSKEEIEELVAISNEIDVIDYGEDFIDDYVDDDFRENPDARINPHITDRIEAIRAKNVVEKFSKSIDPAFQDQIEVYFVNSESDIPAKYQNLRNAYNARYSTSGRGVIWNPGNGKKAVVLIFGRQGLPPFKYQWTLFHEVVGHFGVQRLFGKQFDQFLELSLKNGDLASRAFAMRTRWTNIVFNHYERVTGRSIQDLSKQERQALVQAGMEPESKEDTMYVDDTYFYTQVGLDHTRKFSKTAGFGKKAVSRKAMKKLMDEYIAELAGQASLGDFGVMDKAEQGFIRRVVGWFRHLLRKSGFGSVADKIDNADLIRVLKASYNNLVHDPIVTKDGKLTPLAQEAQEMTEESIIQGSQAGLYTEADARAVIESIDSRFGRLDNSKWQRSVESMSDKIRRSIVGKHLSSTGWLPHPSKLNAVMNPSKGALSTADDDAKRWFKATDDLTDHERKQVFNFFTTKDADPNQLPQRVRTLAVRSKQQIDDLGEMLVQLGALRRETFEKNSGSYLPLRYWKYLEHYRAGGKKLSFRGYLKQRQDLSDAERQALGKIEDPQFLVAETIATLGRDVALYTMFKNMQTMDRVGNLGWFLGTPKFVKVGNKKMSMDDIDANIKRLEDQLAMGEDTNPLYLREEGIAEINRQLKELTEARTAAIDSARQQDAINAIKKAGVKEEEITQDMIVQYQSDFRRVDDPQYGPLMNKWIRKELYDEIVESGQMYDKNHTDWFSKAFGAGGVAEQANIYWKQFKVTANPPSWVRNGIGNFILLDIGTSTNTGKLLKMMGSVGKDFLNGRSDKYIKWANEYGLFNTTYSAAELNALQSEAIDKYKIMRTKIDDETNKMVKLGKRGLFTLHEKFHSYLEWSRDFYGGMEGLFKTVALRDHIETWERKNGQSIDKIPQAEREAVIRAAVETANKNIFDYSKVPPWMRAMRRLPLIGAPFLTYTFKSIPQSVESLARRPQKFIKYAMFPYVMAQAFMMNNDLDDDDMQEILAMLPKWQKEKGSIFLLPWKDDNGKWQTMDFGYYLPWAPLHDMYLNATNTFDPLNPAMTTGSAMLNTVTNLGFLGGPIPTMISAIHSNKDPFMGTEIVRSYGTAQDKQTDLLRYLADLWSPTFMTSKGVWGRMLDNLGVEPGVWNSGREFTSAGKDRETAVQVAARGAGMNIYGIDPTEERVRKMKAYRFERRKIEQARRKIARDPNTSPQDRIVKIRELNEQLKLLNKKHKEDIRGDAA